MTAAHCAKTLMVASTSGNAVLRQCPKLLMPGMIEFIAKSASSADDDQVSEARTTALGEVWKAISVLFSSIVEDSRMYFFFFRTESRLICFFFLQTGIRLLGILLPTVSLILDPTSSPPSALHMQGVAQLLSYATSSPAVFKEATATLNPVMRETLERSIRQAVGNRGSAQGQQAAKPQISLRSF